MSHDDVRLYAYEVADHSDMPIRTAPVERDWMDASDQRFAYRCLPLTIANQAGWLIENPTTFVAVWNGGLTPHDVQVHFPGDDDRPTSEPLLSSVITVSAGAVAAKLAAPPRIDSRISSHFGNGVVTISMPYLFRTPPSVNLWVKGPSNWIKDGAQALEGIVESDWSAAPFTMNWKLTRKNHPVCFERGEPICMIVPIPRGLSESLEPIRMPLARRPELQQLYENWSRSRADFLQALHQGQPDAVRAGWQRAYTKGLMPDNTAAPEHQTRVQLKEFERAEGVPGANDRALERNAIPINPGNS